MEHEIIKSTPNTPVIVVDAHLDFKLDGWPASVALITLCLSGVMIYGIKVLGQKKINERLTYCSLIDKNWTTA